MNSDRWIQSPECSPLHHETSCILALCLLSNGMDRQETLEESCACRKTQHIFSWVPQHAMAASDGTQEENTLLWLTLNPGGQSVLLQGMALNSLFRERPFNPMPEISYPITGSLHICKPRYAVLPCRKVVCAPSLQPEK